MDDLSHKTRDLLVIGYGNELRSDDGVGPKVASAVAELHWPATRTITCHQLTPELADPISQSKLVVFVDASAEPCRDVQLRALSPRIASEIMAHTTDPASLLALSKRVFGRCPAAWSLTIPVENLGFGEMLSQCAQAGMQAALEQLASVANVLG